MKNSAKYGDLLTQTRMSVLLILIMKIGHEVLF